MTIASVKRKFPRLVRQAEKDLRLRFMKKPVLVLCQNGRPRGQFAENRRSRVLITRRMARTNEQASTLAILHELREVLQAEHGVSKTKAHRTAMKLEKKDRKRYGLDKSVRWIFVEYYRRGC